ncbi:MAG: hypothetical protein Q4D65_07655 [Peptostreptococcaceae bacterium]|nr:hypothetical protein [Peptostreptococcaceae bacterium]
MRKSVLIFIFVFMLSMIFGCAKSNIPKDQSNQNSSSTAENEEFKNILLQSGSSIEIDLNGDGTKERIAMDEKGDLKVNDIADIEFLDYAVSNPPNSPESVLIIDINRSDTQKEILFYNEGPSFDPECNFYIWNGDMQYIGTAFTALNLNNIESQVKGDGYIQGELRLNVLQTWFANAQWELNKNNEVHLIQQLKFVPTNAQREYKLISPIRVYKRYPHAQAAIVQPQKVRITATDNHSYCYLEAEDGTKGWFQIFESWAVVDLDYNNVSAMEFFDGLSYAD